jgi:hypothetical protein
MKFWEHLGNIDRRIIYLIMAVVVIVPLILTVELPSKVRAMPRTKDIFDHIEQIDPNGTRKAIILSVDFDPQTEPELKPQMEAIIRHAFARDIPLLVLTLVVTGTDIAREAVERIAAEHGKVYGEDYVFLGWKPGSSLVVLGLGNFIDQVFPTDFYGTPLSELPVMEGIRNFDDVGLATTFTGSTYYGTWIVYANQPFGVPVATGVTSVSVADIYPYLGSKQLVGLLAGLKAGAEYERLVKDRYYPNVVVKMLAEDSYQVEIEEQSYDADSNDIVNLARRFNLDLEALEKSLKSEDRFEKRLMLLELPGTDTTTYYRNLTVTRRGKRAVVTLEGQKLTLNKEKMLALIRFYDVSESEVIRLSEEHGTKESEITETERSIFLRGTQALPALSASLIVIILFVIIGNISYFATRRKK